ncbi:cobalt ECF transporter T component CbiQ [Pelagibacterium halotolerans]|uniref:Transmembrane component NikQ of energizing module of nickel ECF transporter n=1 Tax=Pelagibacterium halotolerans (strain DSM 22347 / JCM 15775 / CGMCC 1.7692 / B2) TaxID=1082931 RepID=G4R721_PELHB|nr:cobalt ECF transporter T component CbiQ [Pelagibacterium halotolerans]AEQ50175.1 transmembrane component NikQ of energizing module of nickel ECF transporter [Pelagibacterium halotolerans B2]QJR19817.1 cobalt ECF transporter T component CbiQ [Pelagibacterium halotolerans]SEA49781.1 cobalt/nickel transport system permease protein [Pelagibacterium halotolerans]
MSMVLESGGAAPAGTTGLLNIDPRFRIGAVGVFAIVVISLSSFPALGAALAVALAMLLQARLPVARTVRQVATVDTFMIFVIISMPFTVPGTPFLSVLGLTASWEGLWEAVRITLKANAIVLAMLTLVGTIGPVELGHALARLKVPPIFVHLLLFTIRYIEVLHAEYGRLRIAMRTRCFVAGTNMHTLRTFGYLIGMLLIRALERSERIMAAMRCRGFNGTFPLIHTSHFCPRRDLGFTFGVAVLCCGLIALEMSHVLSL